MFFKRLKFYKNNFETRFCRLAHFTRILVLGCYACFWTPFEIYVLHGDFDVSMCQMSHLRCRFCKLSWTKLSQIMRWRVIAPSVDSPQTCAGSSQYTSSDMGNSTRTVIGDCKRHRFLSDFLYFYYDNLTALLYD